MAKFLRWDPIEGTILKRTIIGDPENMEKMIQKKEQGTTKKASDRAAETSSKFSRTHLAAHHTSSKHPHSN